MAAFTANPLSLSMSNEAVGAWVKDTKAEEEREARRRRDRSGGGASGSRGGSSRGSSGSDTYAYKTPYLTVSDLRKPPAPWREFLCADDPRRGYAIPRSILDAKRRLDANAFTFLGNYRTAAFAVVCCVLYNDPRALVGAVVVARMWDALGRANANEDPRSFNAKFKRSLATIISWGVGAYCKVTVALSFAIVLVAAMIAVHGSLRRLDAPKPDYGKSPKRVKSHLGRLTRDR